MIWDIQKTSIETKTRIMTTAKKDAQLAVALGAKRVQETNV